MCVHTHVYTCECSACQGQNITDGFEPREVNVRAKTWSFYDQYMVWTAKLSLQPQDNELALLDLMVVPILLASFMSVWHEPESSGEREPRLRNAPSSLACGKCNVCYIFSTDDWYGRAQLTVGNAILHWGPWVYKEETEQAIGASY